MTAPHKQPNKTIKLAAALCALKGPDGQRLIPHDDAKKMTAEQVISLFHFNHHPIPHAEGGPLVHWNLDPELIPAHRDMTAKVDVPGIAKRKRVAQGQERHLARMAAKATGEAIADVRPRGSKLQSRGFQPGHRPLRSRNNLRRAKR